MAEYYDVDRITYGGNTYHIKEYIDDNAGAGDTDVTWSADKLTSEFADRELSATISTPSSVVSFNDGAPYPMSLQFAVECVQAGTGDPSPQNIRPITGFDGANVTVTGKNLAKSTGFVSGVLDWDKSTANTVIASSDYITSDFIPISDGYDKITVSAISGNFVRFYMLDSEKKKLYFRGNHPTQTEGSLTVVMVPGCKYIRFSIGVDGSTFTPSDYGTSLKAQIEYGETATTYEPYAGTTYPITFPASAGTIYGATVKVNPDGTGELVVDRKTIIFDGATDGKKVTNLGGRETTDPYNFYLAVNDGYLFRRTSAGWVQTQDLLNAGMMYSHGPVKSEPTDEYRLSCYIGASGTVMQPRIYFPYGDGITTVAECNTYLAGQYANGTPVQIIYPLKENIIYSLTPGQVLSLLGQNNVWTDVGDITSLSYVRNTVPELIRQDTAGQIASALDPVESSLAIVIDGDVAVGGLDSGKYIYLRSHSTLARGLYHTTAAIADGANITDNNTEPDDEGIANSLNDYNKTEEITSDILYRTGNLVTLRLRNYEVTSITFNNSILQLDSSVKPLFSVYAIGIVTKNTTSSRRIIIGAVTTENPPKVYINSIASYGDTSLTSIEVGDTIDITFVWPI